MLAVLLKEAGYRTVTFSGGEEFLENFRRGAYDLILLDIRMPDIDGYALFDTVRETDREVPIIAVTGKAYEEDGRRIMSHGFSAIVTKPIIDMKAFLRVLASQLVAAKRRPPTSR